MRKPVYLFLATSLFLVGCGGWSDSRVNPRNWFGESRNVAVQNSEATGEVNPLIPPKKATARSEEPDRHVLVTTVTALQIEPTLSGAIIRATGLVARQGAYEIELRPVNEDDTPEDGVLAYTFYVRYPNGPTPVGPEKARLVEVAHSLTRQELAQVRTVRVTGATNSRESRRR